MNGITGIYGKNTSAMILENMLGRMVHRGSERKMMIKDEFAGAEITSGNEERKMRKKSSVLFSGKIYNSEEMTKMLEKPYDYYRDHDDLLVYDLYEKTGSRFVSLLDGVFAFAIHGEEGLFMARDPFGIVPLYYIRDEERMVFASEMKALTSFGQGFKEFPIGSYYEEGKGFSRYYRFSESNDRISQFEEAIKGINHHLELAVEKRIETKRPFGVYLSGGLDSSIIAAITADKIKGIDSFAVGMEGSEDLKHARICADYLGTNHHEYIYDIEEMMKVLPEVIYHLESYDAPLVRSSVANFILARLAGEKAEVVFSGEGADELFCGYKQFKKMSESEAYDEMVHMLDSLHNTGLQRGDRMSNTQGISARVPFLDKDFVEYAMSIPISMKIGPKGQEKWILRKAYEKMLPAEIVYRKKDKFSVGAGSSEKLAEVAEKIISDEEFAKHSTSDAGRPLRSKEELMYYKIFRDFYPEPSVEKSIDFTKVI